jgi:hypothetical protein
VGVNNYGINGIIWGCAAALLTFSLSIVWPKLGSIKGGTMLWTVMPVCIIALIHAYLGLTFRVSEEFGGRVKNNISEVLAGLVLSCIIGAAYGASLTFVAQKLVRR